MAAYREWKNATFFTALSADWDPKRPTSAPVRATLTRIDGAAATSWRRLPPPIYCHDFRAGPARRQLPDCRALLDATGHDHRSPPAWRKHLGGEMSESLKACARSRRCWSFPAARTTSAEMLSALRALSIGPVGLDWGAWTSSRTTARLRPAARRGSPQSPWPCASSTPFQRKGGVGVSSLGQSAWDRQEHRASACGDARLGRHA